MSHGKSYRPQGHTPLPVQRHGKVPLFTPVRLSYPRIYERLPTSVAKRGRGTHTSHITHSNTHTHLYLWYNEKILYGDGTVYSSPCK